MPQLFIEVSVVDLKKPFEVVCRCGTVCRAGLYPIQVWCGDLRLLLYADSSDFCPQCGQEMIGPALFKTKEEAFHKAQEIRVLVNKTMDISCLNRYRLRPGQLSIDHDYTKDN